MITILTRKSTQPGDVQAITKLDHQLNPNRTPLTLAEVLNSDSTYVFVYRQQQQIVGMATLVCYRVVSGYKGWIEDVVVDQSQRGQGVGKQLMQALLEKARSLQLQQLLLYTESEKQAAIHLYQQLGFTHKDSQIYCLDL